MHKKLPNNFIFTDEYNNEIFKNKNRNIGIIYRNYNNENREKHLIKIAKACKRSRYQLFVSNDLKLAYKFKADGIYIPSFNKKKFLNLEKKNFVKIGSAHSQKEIHKKIEQNCQAKFLSPLFHIKKSKSQLHELMTKLPFENSIQETNQIIKNFIKSKKTSEKNK